MRIGKLIISKIPLRISLPGGRKAKERSTHLVVDIPNYRQVEDIHLLLGHVLNQYFPKLIVAERKIWVKRLNAANIKVSFL